jgi:enoyl-CoA hydratase
MASRRAPTSCGLLPQTNRPEKLNAADEAFHDEFGRVWQDVARNPKTKVAVNHRSGQCLFRRGRYRHAARETLGDFRKVARTRQQTSQRHRLQRGKCGPIHHRRRGPIHRRHVRIGVVTGNHSVILWPLLTSDVLEGREAGRIGLMSSPVAGEQLIDEAIAVDNKLATCPQESVRRTKQALNNWLRQAGPLPMRRWLWKCSRAWSRHCRGTRTVVEKRTPEFLSAKFELPEH